MAGRKVTEFDPAAALNGSEIFGVVQAAGNVQTTLDDLTDYISVLITGGIVTYTDENARDAIGAALVAGTGVTITVDDPGDTITISASGSYTDEQARDAIGAALVAGTNVTITVDDPGDTITIASSGAATPNIQSVVSAATVTPTFSNDMVKITAQAVALTLANPTGTPVDGHGLVIRIKDNGTARAITYGSQYREVGTSLPVTTDPGFTVYIALIWNNDDTKWDAVAVSQEE